MPLLEEIFFNIQSCIQLTAHMAAATTEKYQCSHHRRRIHRRENLERL